MLNSHSTKKTKKFDKGLIFLIVIVLIIAATVFIIYFQFRTDRLSEDIQNGLPIKILFIFSEKEKPLFFEIFMYQPSTHRGSILYFPKNVGSIIKMYEKVDAVGSLYRKGNYKDLREKIGEMIGIDIPFVIDMDVEDLRKMVDLLGGLELFIPNPVDTRLNGQRVLLPSGSVKLDGDKIVDFILYEEKHESEIDKIGRKQRMLQTLLKRLAEEKSYITNPKVFAFFKKYSTTNISDRSMKTLVNELTNMDSGRIIFQRVLGTMRKVDESELLFPHYNGELLKEKVKQTLETLASKESIDKNSLVITVEILNGTNINGLAGRTREVYQSFGFDVISIGNADNKGYINTVVLDRKGKLERAKKAAEVIHCDRVYTKPDPNIDDSIDVTIILGKDFDGRYCQK